MKMTSHRRCASCDENTPPATISNQQQQHHRRRKNVLDIRMVPGDPQGAWVECYDNTYDEHAQAGKAEEHAARIHHKYEQMKQERDEKLRNFQTDVTQRVRCLERLKKMQLNAKTIKNEEDEQTAILQRTLGLKIPYKGTMQDLQQLNKELLKSCIVPCDVNKHVLRHHAKESNQLLSATSKEITSETNKAKTNLLTKRIGTEQIDLLPGGNWKISKHLQGNHATHAPTKSPVFNKPLTDAWTGQHQIKQHRFTDGANGGGDGVEGGDGDGLGSFDRREICGDDGHVQSGFNGADGGVRGGEICVVDDDGGEEEGECDEGLLSESLLIEHMAEYGINKLHKNLIIDWCEKQHRETTDGKRQAKDQYWNYRKIFMEIEREQVQEYRRKQEHRKQVLRLKIEKEKERELAEAEQFSDFPETTVVSIDQTLPNKDTSILSHKHGILKHDQQEEKELYRYIDALRGVAKERLKVSNRPPLPPLCACGATIWDSHPETCANNCVFYKNPKGYVRALTTILANNR